MGVTHHLDGTLQENLHGWFDAGLEPRVTVEPGDRVVYRTADAMWDRDAPDAGTDRPRLARPEGAGHALAGPVRIPCRSSSVCELVAASTPMRPGRRLEPADHGSTFDCKDPNTWLQSAAECASEDAGYGPLRVRA